MNNPTSKSKVLAVADLLDGEAEKRRNHGKSSVGPLSSRLAKELRAYAERVHMDGDPAPAAPPERPGLCSYCGELENSGPCQRQHP